MSLLDVTHRISTSFGASCSIVSWEKCGCKFSASLPFVAAAAAANATSLESSASPTAPTSRVSRRQPKKGGIRRGKGWRNTPEPGQERPPAVLSPSAATLVRDIRSQKGPQDVWDVLDSLPRGIGTWEDLMEAVSELRRQRDWRTVILIFEWILQAKMFKPDVGCFNMLMDAYGRNKQWAEAEKTFHLMKSFQCVPTEISFNVLMAAFSRGGQLEKAEALFDEMKESNYAPGLVTYNTYLEVLSKTGNLRQAEYAFLEMQKRGILPVVNTYTIMINMLTTQRRLKVCFEVCGKPYVLPVFTLIQHLSTLMQGRVIV